MSHLAKLSALASLSGGLHQRLTSAETVMCCTVDALDYVTIVTQPAVLRGASLHHA